MAKTFEVTLERTIVQRAKVRVDANCRVAAGFQAARATPEWEPHSERIKIDDITALDSSAKSEETA